MAKKIVKVEAVQDCKFKMIAKTGNHQVIIDQPKPMGGNDEGPNPLELSLVSLAACIGAIGRIVANQKKLNVGEIKVSVEGELNTDSLLGISNAERAGYKNIVVNVSFDSDMTKEEKVAYLNEIDSRCPISDNMANESTLVFNVVD